MWFDRYPYPDPHCDDRVAFKAEGLIIERVGRDETIWDLSWKSSLPILNGIGCECSMHALDHLRQCDSAGRGKAVAQKLQSEEMVGMRMRDIDRGQTPAGSGDPVG